MYRAMDNDDPRSDSQLLRDSTRQADAFGVFYDRHARDLGTFFVRRTADHALAADLTSETFAHAFAHRRRYRDTGHPATSWLYTIAVRQLSEAALISISIAIGVAVGLALGQILVRISQRSIAPRHG